MEVRWRVAVAAMLEQKHALLRKGGRRRIITTDQQLLFDDQEDSDFGNAWGWQIFIFEPDI